MKDVWAHLSSDIFQQLISSHPGYGGEGSGTTFSPQVALPWYRAPGPDGGRIPAAAADATAPTRAEIGGGAAALGAFS